MAGQNKRKTTMAKLNREAKLREKRQEKAARKEARRLAAENGTGEPEHVPAEPALDPDELDAAVQRSLATG